MEPIPDKQEQVSKEIKSNSRALFGNVKKFLVELLNIRSGIDIGGTIDGINKDIEFKGHSVWILICSIFIASIGLNTNSTAVVIGAMLISPLMGPILGIGLSIGRNDFQTLLKSLKNFGVMVAISLLTSVFYFLVSPLHEAQPELLSRTQPTILDVFIALFGGMAGIIAGTRKEKSNIIPGVAIATALMPPLCTAGYGIAIGNLNFFFGAIYLFLLNSVFICLSTYVFVRYLRFPLTKFMDPIREKKVKRYIYFFLAIVVIPSGWIFWNVLKESYFKNKAELFMSENFMVPGTEIIDSKFTYTDTLCVIDVFTMGDEIPEKLILDMNSRLELYGLKNGIFVKNTSLKLHQPNNTSHELEGMITKLKSDFYENSYEKNLQVVQEKEQEINRLNSILNRFNARELPILKIKREIEINYPEIKSIAYAELINTKENKLDTIPTFFVKWESLKLKKKNAEKLTNWLRERLDLKNLVLKDY